MFALLANTSARTPPGAPGATARPRPTRGCGGPGEGRHRGSLPGGRSARTPGRASLFGRPDLRRALRHLRPVRRFASSPNSNAEPETMLDSGEYLETRRQYRRHATTSPSPTTASTRPRGERLPHRCRDRHQRQLGMTGRSLFLRQAGQRLRRHAHVPASDRVRRHHPRPEQEDPCAHGVQRPRRPVPPPGRARHRHAARQAGGHERH